MACPMRTRRSMGIILKPTDTVENLTKAISRELGLTNNKLMDETNSTLRKHGFENFSHLCRLSDPNALTRLNLPLLYEREIVTLIIARNRITSRTAAISNSLSSMPKSATRLMSRASLEQSSYTNTSSEEEILSSEDVYTANAYPFTPAQRDIINNTWQKITGGEHGSMSDMAKKVYERIFSYDPGAKRLFGGSDLLAVSRAFGGMLGLLASAVNRPLQFEHLVRGLGIRHQIYGVKPDHFRLMYTSLMKTFTALLGKEEFTNIHKDAWRCLYDWVSDLMQRSMRDSTSGHKSIIMMGTDNSKFRKYYATLTNFRLFITKKRKAVDQIPKFEISLGEISDVHEATEDLGNPVKFKELCFILETRDGERINFACSSEVERNEWLNELDWRVVATSRTAASVFHANQEDLNGPKNAYKNKESYKRWRKRNKVLGLEEE